MVHYVVLTLVCAMTLATADVAQDIVGDDYHADAGAQPRGGRADCNNNGIPDEIEIGPPAGHALLFDGAYDYLEPTYATELAALGQGDFTLEAWVWTDSTSRSVVIGNVGGETRFYNLVIREDGLVRITIGDGGTEKDCFSNTAIADGTWHHVAVVRRVGEDGSLDVIIDGASDAYTLVSNAPFTAADATFIGRDARTNPPFMEGALDDLRVWNVARTQTQIAADMNSALAGNEPGLLAYWRFDEGTGVFTYDSAGDNHCELVAEPEWVPIDEDCNANGVPDDCEVGGTEDCNTNGAPDLCDIYDGTSPDCNANGIPDECDIAGGASQDCNTNGMPDECDIAAGTSQDCNANGVPDACDITGGTSQDCNTNGVPDECDIAAGTSQDCNTNGIPDDCEAGSAEDCNTNGVPDLCDIFVGTSQDCNSNDIPDECEVGGTADCNTNGVPDLCDLFNGTSQDCNEDDIPDECGVLPTGVLYVEDDATGGLNDGSSWSNAFIELADALAHAPCPGVTEIRIAGGTYTPGASRSDTFKLTSGVAVRGGYRGLAGGGHPDDRDFATFVSVLSGDINGDDQPDWINRGDNSYHVVTGSRTDTTAELDGVTITAGSAYGSFEGELYQRYGGGMYNDSGSPTVANCVFTGNRVYLDGTSGGGGGMYNLNSHPAVANCTFNANSADGGGYAFAGLGGGMYNDGSSPTLTNCTFSANLSATADIQGGGGGIYNRNSSPTLTNCTFNANSGDDIDGGGMCNDNSNPTLANCTFITNYAYRGGGMANRNNSTPTLANCTFIANSTYNGGGVYSANSAPTLANCTFLANSASGEYARGGGLYDGSNGSSTLANCILWGNTASTSGQQIHNDAGSTTAATFSCIQGGWPGTGNISTDPLLGPALRPVAGSPCIDAGDNSAVPADTCDLDGDGDTTEPCPLDAAGRQRFFDEPNTPDTGNGTAPIVDMGAFECAPAPPGSADLDGDGDVDIDDFELFQQQFTGPQPYRTDMLGHRTAI